MITIRTAQLEAMGMGRLALAKTRIADELRRHWPAACAQLGGVALAVWIDRGVEACQRRGIDTEQDFAHYGNVMFALGPDFEEDPRYPWARRVLDDAALRPAARIDRLCALVSKWLVAEQAAEVHAGKPLLSAELPETGERFEGALPPADGSCRPSFAARSSRRRTRANFFECRSCAPRPWSARR